MMSPSALDPISGMVRVLCFATLLLSEKLEAGLLVIFLHGVYYEPLLWFMIPRIVK